MFLVLIFIFSIVRVKIEWVRGFIEEGFDRTRRVMSEMSEEEWISISHRSGMWTPWPEPESFITRDGLTSRLVECVVREGWGLCVRGESDEVIKEPKVRGHNQTYLPAATVLFNISTIPSDLVVCREYQEMLTRFL